jgi:YHS domain-containing protein
VLSKVINRNFAIVFGPSVRCAIIATSLALICAVISLPALAHDVKDPVCRMQVDSDTTKYSDRLGGKTFFFCSPACRDKFIQSPEKYTDLAAELEKSNGHTYSVDLVTPRRAMAGHPVDLKLAIRYADTKKLVSSFEITHTKLLHLIMVRRDLGWYEHQHPILKSDGLFHLSWTFPSSGTYYLYADFTPSDGDNQVIRVPIAVSGKPTATLPLIAEKVMRKRVGDCNIELQVKPPQLRMEQPALLTYRFRDDRGRPITDMQPFIGVSGHLIALSEDGKQYVHTHPLTEASQPSSSYEPVKVTADLISQSGPVFTFKLTLPSSGLYRVWAQFMHHNKVITVPFTFKVADIWENTSP